MGNYRFTQRKNWQKMKKLCVVSLGNLLNHGQCCLCDIAAKEWMDQLVVWTLLSSDVCLCCFHLRFIHTPYTVLSVVANPACPQALLSPGYLSREARKLWWSVKRVKPYCPTIKWQKDICDSACVHNGDTFLVHVLRMLCLWNGTLEMVGMGKGQPWAVTGMYML